MALNFMVATPDVNYKVPTDFHFVSLLLSGLPPALDLVWFYAPEITQQNQRNPLLTLIRPRQGFYSKRSKREANKKNKRKAKKNGQI